MVKLGFNRIIKKINRSPRKTVIGSPELATTEVGSVHTKGHLEGLFLNTDVLKDII